MKQIRIDGAKLRKCIGMQNKSEQKISEEIGFSKGYLSKAINRGVVGEPVVNMLKINYGIDLDLYKYEEKSTAETNIQEGNVASDSQSSGDDQNTKEKQFVKLDNQKLYAVIYSAMLDAMRQFQSEKGQQKEAKQA